MRSCMVAIAYSSVLLGQTAPFERDALRCVYTSTEVVFVQSEWRNGHRVLTFQIDKTPVEVRNSNRVLTLLSNKPVTIMFRNFDPLELELGLSMEHYTDPFFQDAVKILGTLAQGQEGLVPVEDTLSSAINIGQANVDGNANEDVVHILAAGADLLRPLRTDGGERGQTRVNSAIRKCHSLSEKLDAESVRLLRIQEEILKKGADLRTDTEKVRLIKIPEAIPQLKALKFFYQRTAQRLTVFDHKEAWVGDDLILARTDQTPQQSTVLHFKYLDSQTIERKSFEQSIAFRYPYFWGVASADLSFGVVYQKFSDLEQTVSHRGNAEPKSTSSTVNWSPAIFGNLAFKMPHGSWVHPMIQYGFGKGSTELMKLTGIGLRFCEPIPFSISWGVAKTGNLTDHFYAIGYNFH